MVKCTEHAQLISQLHRRRGSQVTNELCMKSEIFLTCGVCHHTLRVGIIVECRGIQGGSHPWMSSGRIYSVKFWLIGNCHRCISSVELDVWRMAVEGHLPLLYNKR